MSTKIEGLDHTVKEKMDDHATVHGLGCQVTADEAGNTALHLFFLNGCKVALASSP